MAAFPLLLIPLLLVNALMFLTDGGLSNQLLSMTLPSGAAFSLSAGELAVVIGQKTDSFLI